jgi:hypothetical protein
MTLGNAAAAQVRLLVWCHDCSHQVSPIPLRWPLGRVPRRRYQIGASGLVCSRCGGPADRYVGERDEAAPRVDRPPTPPLVNRSAGVVTPMMPRPSLYPGSGYGEMKPARVRDG